MASCPSPPQLAASSVGVAISTPLLMGGVAATHIAACLALDRHVRLGPDDEAAFWRSDLLAGWQRAYDGVFAVVMVVVQASFIRRLADAAVQPSTLAGQSLADRMAWGWLLQLVTATALCQLAAVVAAPRMYRRHRLPWAVAMRLLRLATNSMQVWAASAHDPMRLGWQNIAASVRERPAPARSLLFGWSGASLGALHTVNTPLPFRWSALVSLLFLLVMVGLHSGSVALELLHPAVLPSYRQLCAPVPRVLGDLTGLYLTDAAAGAWCEEHVQLVVVATQVLGCTVPVAVMALVERAMKDIYMKGRLEQGGAAGPGGAGVDPTAAADGGVAGDATGVGDAVDVGQGDGARAAAAADPWLVHEVARWASLALVAVVGEWVQ